MQHVPVTLDEAIERIQARTNTETYCILEAVQEGEPPITLYPKDLFNEERIRSLGESALTHFPGKTALLHVHDPNGSRTKPNTIYLLITEEMANTTKNKYNQAPPQQQAPRYQMQTGYQGLDLQQLGLEPLALVMLDQRQQQIGYLTEQNSELKDQVKAKEQEVKELKDRNFELERENKFKDREYELEAKAAQAQQQSGLNGLTNTLFGTEQGLQMLMGFASQFMGNKSGAAQPALIAGVNPNEPKGAAINEVATWLGSQDEQTVSEFYAVMMYVQQKRLNLSSIIASVQNGI